MFARKPGLETIHLEEWHLLKEHLNKSSPRKRGSSNPLILKTLDSRFRVNDMLVQTFLEHFELSAALR